MVNTVKFSQFASANLNTSTNTTVGTSSPSGGVNIQSEKFLTWTTAARPSIPFFGLLGANTDSQQYEFWNGIAWVPLATGGSGTITVGLINQIAYYAAPGITLSGTYTIPPPVQVNITTVGTISSGIWNGTIISGTYGGTGVNNGSSTITIGGNVSFIGAFTFAGNLTGNTAVTFPTAGTLATTAQLPTPAALTKTDDTNVTATLTGTPATALLQSVNIAFGWSGQLSVPRGGTGNSTFTAYSVLCAGTTSTGAFQNVSGLGTLNQVLVSQGAGALPIWSSVPGVSPAALTEVNDTNVTLTLGGSPTVALLAATSLTLGWTGQLALTRGGTNASLTASNGGVVYSTASALAILAGTATANLPLLSGSSSAPSWGAFALSLGGALTTAGALTLSGAFAATFTFTNTTSVTFPTSGTLATTSQIPTGAALTKTDDTNVTLTLGGSPSTALINAASLTLGWTGQLSVPRGGTGNSTFTAFSVICAGTTATGAFQNVVGVGTSGQVLQSNGAGVLPTWATIPGATSAALTKTDDTNVTLTLGGSPTVALLAATSLTLGWTGQLGLTRGGTAASLTASNGGIVYSTASALAILAGTATAGLALLSGASTTPSWSTSPPITQINTQTITATGAFTYTPTTGTKYAIFRLAAPGGGTGGVAGTAAQSGASGGAGSGAYLEILVSGATNLAAITGNVGSGGTAGASGNNNGGNGGNTTLTINGGTQWVAGGGALSNGNTSSATTVVSTAPGAGGTNTIGTNATLILNTAGVSGGYGLTFGANTNAFVFGLGGDAQLGRGGNGGNAGAGFGGGGSGSVAVAANVAGVAGSNGVVQVLEFISV